MSYMDRKNILSEGFFSKLFGGLKKLRSKNKNAFEDKKVQKAYDKALASADDALTYSQELLKKYGIKED